MNSPAEAIFALGILLPGFRRFLTGCKDQGIEFAVFIGRENLSKAQLHDPPGADDIRIAPVMVGSKRGGVLQTIVGVVLIVVATIYGGPGAGAGVAKFWGAVGAAGWSLAIGGVVQMFIYPLFYCVLTVTYYDLRVRKEGFDLELLASSLQSA